MPNAHWRSALAAVATAALSVVLLAPPAAAQTPTPTPTPAPTSTPAVPPAIAQLCAATGVDQVDDLLRDLDRDQLVGDLAPLATLTVPDRDDVELDGSVQLEQVRRALNCAPTPTSTPTSTPTTSAAPAPLYATCAAAIAAGAAPIAQGRPGYRSELDADNDGIACEVGDPSTRAVVTDVPSTVGGVGTGWA